MKWALAGTDWGGPLGVRMYDARAWRPGRQERGQKQREAEFCRRMLLIAGSHSQS